MAHFNICVLIESDSSMSLEDLARKKAWPLLNKFMMGEVPPYKQYVEADEVRRMQKYYKTEDLSELAPKVDDWNGGMDAGVDEGGLYATYNHNPEGHYDSWELFTEVPQSEYGRLLFGETGEEKVCHAIITPDGTWIQEGPWTMGATTEDANQKLDAWIERMKEVLEEHKDCTALLADCHS